MRESAKGTYTPSASTQFGFELSFTRQEKHLEDGEHKYELSFRGKAHVLSELVPRVWAHACASAHPFATLIFLRVEPLLENQYR